MKAFHELVGAAFDGEHSTTKVAFLRNWISCYTNLLDLHVTLVEQEKDLAKENHGRSLPGYRNLTLAKIQIEEAKLEEIEESIVGSVTTPKPVSEEVIVPGGEKMMLTVLPLSIPVPPGSEDVLWTFMPCNTSGAIVTGDKKWVKVKTDFHKEVPDRSVMMSEAARKKYKIGLYSKLIFAEEANLQVHSVEEVTAPLTEKKVRWLSTKDAYKLKKPELFTFNSTVESLSDQQPTESSPASPQVPA